MDCERRVHATGVWKAQATRTLTHGLSATQLMYSSKMPEQDLDMKGVKALTGADVTAMR